MNTPTTEMNVTDVHSHNLLVIDDEPSILSALKRQFRRNYQVYIANSAEEGLELMKTHPIQVIISDQRMPGMTGTAFFDQVKTNYTYAIRLLLTGYADIQAVIEAINDGNIYRYITKPWDPAELDTIVRGAFERHDLIVRNEELVTKLQQANVDLESKVQSRTAQLVAVNKDKDRMIGIVAHDLRGPIGNIKMCHDLICKNLNNTTMQSKLLGMIDEVTEKALVLIDDLLDVSAIETGLLVLDKTAVALDPFLDKIIRFNRLAADKKNILLELDYQGPETGTFDRQRIEQVIDNLLGNAFKYSHKNTAVKLSVEMSEGLLHFKIFDKGQGIREDDMNKLFSAFQKTSTLPTNSEHSNGLGLSICKRIVELHGGTIQAESVFGEGSCFSFSLPTVDIAK
jgi:signal transduction histidine kinase